MTYSFIAVGNSFDRTSHILPLLPKGHNITRHETVSMLASHFTSDVMRPTDGDGFSISSMSRASGKIDLMGRRPFGFAPILSYLYIAIQPGLIDDMLRGYTGTGVATM